MNYLNDSDQHPGYKLLGTALLTYMLIIILIITLAPFRYHLPEKFELFWFFNLKEILQNVFLFIPFGFLTRSLLNEKTKKPLFQIFLWGCFVSSFIEFNQFFIFKRITSLIDIIANVSGSVTGAMLYFGFMKKLTANSSKIIIEIPLTILLFLLIPLLWLSSLAIGDQPQRVFLLLPLGLIGGILISEIYLNRVYSTSNLNRSLFVLFFFGWFFVSLFPVIPEFPKTILLFALLLGFFVVIRVAFQKQHVHADNRFELKTLNKIVPVFGLYLISVNRWPIKSFEMNYSFVFVQQELFINSDLDFIIRTIQLFSSFTIVGYILFQYINRAHPKNTVVKLISAVMVFALVIELPRGFHPSQTAAFSTIFFNFFWGMFGALIYILQLYYFKFIRQEQEEQLELDFATKSAFRTRPN